LISGQVAVMQRSGISEVKLVGQDINAPEKALLAIKEADQIIIGPGSLYTSLLAALSAEGIREAIETSEGRKIYIANLQQQKYETFGYNIADHIRALNKHGIKCDVTLLPVKSVLESGDIPDDTETIKVPLTTESGNIHDHNLLGEALAGLWLRHLESDKEV
jgi:uncharacterized cofD-like protein